MKGKVLRTHRLRAGMKSLVSTMILLSIGGVIGIVNNSLRATQDQVSYFHFRKTVIFERDLNTSKIAILKESDRIQRRPSIRRPLEIVFFLSDQCEECAFIRAAFIPSLKQTFGDNVQVKTYDTGSLSHYRILTEYERRYGSQEEVTAKMFTEERYLAGAQEISAGGLNLIDGILKKRASKDKLNG